MSALVAVVALSLVSAGLGIWTVALNMRTTKTNKEIARLLKEHVE